VALTGGAKGGTRPAADPLRKSKKQNGDSKVLRDVRSGQGDLACKSQNSLIIPGGASIKKDKIIIGQQSSLEWGGSVEKSRKLPIRRGFGAFDTHG